MGTAGRGDRRTQRSPSSRIRVRIRGRVGLGSPCRAAGRGCGGAAAPEALRERRAPLGGCRPQRSAGAARGWVRDGCGALSATGGPSHTHTAGTSNGFSFDPNSGGSPALPAPPSRRDPLPSPLLSRTPRLHRSAALWGCDGFGIQQEKLCPNGAAPRPAKRPASRGSQSTAVPGGGPASRDTEQLRGCSHGALCRGALRKSYGTAVTAVTPCTPTPRHPVMTARSPAPMGRSVG